jgi:hypothetical protein
VAIALSQTVCFHATDMQRKNRVLDQITARHHPQTAPTDSFLCTRASASMAGANNRWRDSTPFQGTQWTFSPASAPTPPWHLHIAVWGSSAAVMHCHVTTRFNVNSCPAKDGALVKLKFKHHLTRVQLFVTSAQEPRPPWEVQRSCARYLKFPVRAQWTFSPGLQPTPPWHLHFAAQATSRWQLPCCKRIAFNASTCPRNTESCSNGVSRSNPNPAPTDCFLCTGALASKSETKDRTSATEQFTTCPMTKPL